MNIQGMTPQEVKSAANAYLNNPVTEYKEKYTAAKQLRSSGFLVFVEKDKWLVFTPDSQVGKQKQIDKDIFLDKLHIGDKRKAETIQDLQRFMESLTYPLNDNTQVTQAHKLFRVLKLRDIEDNAERLTKLVSESLNTIVSIVKQKHIN